MSRSDGRRADQLRPTKITRAFTDLAPGSVLICQGRTRLLCTACWQPNVPDFLKGSGRGWVTAEYDMLPSSTGQRRRRARTGKIDGRAQEIQRLIGRTMRSVLDMSELGENTIYLDCDVIQADGGTRTAAITGAYVALADALTWARKQRLIRTDPLTDAVAAVSVFLVEDADQIEHTRWSGEGYIARSQGEFDRECGDAVCNAEVGIRLPACGVCQRDIVDSYQRALVMFAAGCA